MAKKRFYDKAKSKQDSSMIGGTVGLANLPQDVIMKYYPKGSGYLNEDLKDDMKVIDNQQIKDVNDTKKEKSQSKY